MIKLKDILKEEKGLNPSEKFALKEVGEQIVQTHKRLNELLFKYMVGLKKYHSKHKDNPSVAKKIYDLWNHIKGNYYYTTKQAAGRYMLPFEKQYKKLVSEGKLNEGSMSQWYGNWHKATSDLLKTIGWLRALTHAPKVPDVIKKDKKLDKMTNELYKQYDRIEKYVDKMGYHKEK
tara:strand:+ start:93 stop:620 length:528 start_codon:yes stop_codon:yes gene_type:complete